VSVCKELSQKTIAGSDHLALFSFFSFGIESVASFLRGICSIILSGYKKFFG
jgi:hypothetical protein